MGYSEDLETQARAAGMPEELILKAREMNKMTQGRSQGGLRGGLQGLLSGVQRATIGEGGGKSDLTGDIYKTILTEQAKRNLPLSDLDMARKEYLEQQKGLSQKKGGMMDTFSDLMRRTMGETTEQQPQKQETTNPLPQTTYEYNGESYSDTELAEMMDEAINNKQITQEQADKRMLEIMGANPKIVNQHLSDLQTNPNPTPQNVDKLLAEAMSMIGDIEDYDAIMEERTSGE